LSVISRNSARPIPDGIRAHGWDRLPMVHPIVVAMSDGAAAREAIALGITAARLLSAPLVLAGVAVVKAPSGVTVVHGWSSATDDTLLRDDVANVLHRRADAVPDDVSCTIHVETATGILPGLEIIIEKEQAQLIVVGASHLDPLAGVLRHGQCPVLVVPEGAPDDALPVGRGNGVHS
jgi:nucleotide-binding universal stress UspA family protein